MNLSAKISEKYFDEILTGEKNVEYRQFEDITLTTPSGRSVTVKVLWVEVCEPDIDDQVREIHDSIEWDNDLNIHRIFLGEVVPCP